MTARPARQAILASAALAALLAASPLRAQTAALPVQEVAMSPELITIADATTLAQAALAACRAIGLPTTARVFDAQGFERLMMSDDKAMSVGLDTSAQKAAAVLDFRASTADLTARLKDPRFAEQYGKDPRYHISPGAFALYRGDAMVGVLAVGCSRNRDADCANVAIKSLPWAAFTPASGERATGPEAGDLVYFGSHEHDVFAARFDSRTGRFTPLGQVAHMERPTWIVADAPKSTLYVVNETGNDGKAEGGVYSFAPDLRTGQLKPLNKVGSGGGGATHLAIDNKSQTIFVSNFGTGHVSAAPINPDGSVAPVASKFQEVGSGPHLRQPYAHAHGTSVDPTGRYVLSADMGADRVFVYRFDPATRQLIHLPEADITTPPGTGPRHVVFSPDGKAAYAITELTADLQSYRWDPKLGRLQLAQTLPAGGPVHNAAQQGAEVVTSSDGRFVYVSVRGDNVAIVYSVDRKTGKLTEAQRLAAKGATPWSFSLDPTERWLLVANEASNQVTVFKRDPATGLLSETAEYLPIPKPVSVTFFPGRQAVTTVAAK